MVKSLMGKLVSLAEGNAMCVFLGLDFSVQPPSCSSLHSLVRREHLASAMVESQRASAGFSVYHGYE